jgi:hypothetical protein
MSATKVIDQNAGLSFCRARGYCGPFLHAERYSAIPGWEGIADCAICRNTVQVERHRLLWEEHLIFRGSSRS